MNFVKGFQRILDEEYSKFQLCLSSSLDQLSVAEGCIFIRSKLAFDNEEWKRNNSRQRKVLVRVRILDMLYQSRDLINEDIERIENEETR